MSLITRANLKTIEFWMSGEIEINVDDSHRTARKIIEKQVNESIGTNHYGEGLKLWSYLAIILDSKTAPYYPEVKRYSRRKKEVEFRLKINHRKFLEGSPETHLRLLSESVLRSLKLMHEMKIKDLDLDRLEADVTKCLSKYLK